MRTPPAPRPARHFLSIAVALLVPLACAGKVSPIDTSDGGPDGTPTDAAAESTASPEACKACVDSTCPHPWNACTSDPSCVALIDCISKCGTKACEDACTTSHPSTTGSAVLACFRGPCKDACTKSVGG